MNINSNGRGGMATLLQQKNCMKTLTNGGVSGEAAAPFQTTSSSRGSNNTQSSNSGTGASTANILQQTRVLLPHEMVSIQSTSSSATTSTTTGNSIPINNIVTTTGIVGFSSGGSGGIISANSGGLSGIVELSGIGGSNTFIITGTNSNLNNQQIIQQQQQVHNQRLNHNHQANATPTSTTTTIQQNLSHNQFSRYFSQINNQDTNSIIYMPITTASTTSGSTICTSNSLINHCNNSIQNSHIILNLTNNNNNNNNNNINNNNNLLINNTSAVAAATSSIDSLTSSLSSSSSSTITTISPSLLNQQHFNHELMSVIPINNSTSLSQYQQQQHPHQQNYQQQRVQLSSNNTIENSNIHNKNNNTSVETITEAVPNGDIEQEQISPPVNVDDEPEPEIDIVINNVVCSFSVRCHLNLREIALNGFNVEFRRENGMVTMKLRRPYTTASIWSSGRITCTGATSEDQAKIAARRYARCLQKLGFNVRFHNFRVVNVLGTCSMPWAIKIVNFSERYKKDASYEPELHPGVTYKLRYPKATLKIFSTGSITVTAGSVAHVQAAIEHIFPLVYEFRKKRSPEDIELIRAKNNRSTIDEIIIEEADEIHSPSAKRKRPLGRAENDPTDDIIYLSDNEDYIDETDANVV